MSVLALRCLPAWTLLVFVLSAAPASARLVTWEFTGTVTTDTPNPLSVVLPVGAEVLMQVTVDPNAVDSCPDPDSGFYSMPGSSVRLAGQTYASDWTALEVHNPLGNCVGGTQDSTFRLIDFPGAPFYSVAIGWPDPQSGDGLPAVPTADDAYFFISYIDLSATVWGRIDSVRAIPEPSAMTLMAVAGLATALLRRRG